MNGEPMTTKHITMISPTSRQLLYMLVCVMSIVLGVSGVAQGQVTPRPTPIPPPSFEEFGNTFCQNPNAAAVGAAIDSAKKRLAEVPPNDSKGRSVIELLTFKSINQKDELCELLDDRIPAEEVTAVFTLGFSQANIQSDNLSRRMLAIRTGSGSSVTGFTINSGVSEFSMGL